MYSKFFISVCIATIISCSSIGQANIFFFGGPQTATASYSIRNTKQSTDYKFGFRAGVGMKVNFDEHLFFSPTLSFSRNGYKVKFDRSASPPDSSAKDNNVTLNQVDIDVHLQYDIGSQPNHFFINAGPTFNVIASGTEKFHLAAGEPISRNMKLGLYSAYGRLLVAFVAAVGYETSSGLYFNAQYAHGLISMNNADSGPVIYQRLFGLNIGYILHSKKVVLDTKNKE